MAKIVVLGAGVSGHTAAMYAKRMLGRKHDVTVISPNSKWNWIPSNIWVGVGRMTEENVLFPLAPVYKRHKINYHQAKAVTIRPEGTGDNPTPLVEIEYTSTDRMGETGQVYYDYLVNATGPRLKFEATPGLGPDGGNTVSVCTARHAVQASAQLDDLVRQLRAGDRKTLVVGMGHGSCTCEGAAFEYVFNVDQILREEGVRHLAEVVYLTNEHELGDFGVGGMDFVNRGRMTSSEEWMKSLFKERDIRVIQQAHVTSISEHRIEFDTISGESGSQDFDFAMLLPPFGGAGLNALDADGNDITSVLFAPNGFMKVDARYGVESYEDWTATDWPSTYENPTYDNVFAVGIAFAPPHAISKPYQTPKGDTVAPAPPRTGMPSGVQGMTVAKTIGDRVKHGVTAPAHTASMAKMGAACIASVGHGATEGEAATITMSPIVPDHAAYPKTGRNLHETFGEIGLAGHWMKRLLHTLFIYKAKGRPGWWLIPE